MKHRGKILEKAVRNTKISIYKVAEMIGKSQRTMYTLFEREDISDADMVAFGKAIGYDFSKDIPELVDYMMAKEPKGEYLTQTDYRQKYLLLLERFVIDAEDYKSKIVELEKLLAEQRAPSETAASKVRQIKS